LGRAGVDWRAVEKGKFRLPVILADTPCLEGTGLPDLLALWFEPCMMVGKHCKNAFQLGDGGLWLIECPIVNFLETITDPMKF
jgi:hypothetical protein